MEPKISVVMPALNEEQNVARAIRNALHAFEKIGVSGEVIVVNDGSRDRTAEIVAELQTQSPFVKVVTHGTPLGIGKSFWDGVQTARGEIVTMLPGDAENDAFEILRYLPLMDHVDIVVPFVFNQGQRSSVRRIVSSAYRVIINCFFGTSLNYMNGTVLYRRSILKTIQLSSAGFFYQTELLIRCLSAGYLFAEVPYGLMQREKGHSTALSVKSLRRLIVDFVKLKFSLWAGESPSLHPQSLSAIRRVEFTDSLSLSAPTAPCETAVEY